MDEPHDPNSPAPLVMRSYRRHRRQSRFGTWSLFVPPVGLLWAIFWYLMMQGPSLTATMRTDNTSSWMALLIGGAVIQFAGVIMGIVGLLDPYYKKGHAAMGLALNASLLVGALLVLLMRMFAQSSGV